MEFDALLLMENFARMLGIGIATYVNVFEPDRLAIGGGISRASHLFLDRAVREAGARALPFRSNIPKLAEFTFTRIDPDYPRRALELTHTSGHLVIGGVPGQQCARP